ncbi:MAG TPA: endonuclease/exonuclease/phosphatase family protein [Verrucomicrobiota bacterium]|nr:endonuclease/exonuclease/phosphatase family protein [Verrucomicrobiota bacterium]
MNEQPPLPAARRAGRRPGANPVVSRCRQDAGSTPGGPEVGAPWRRGFRAFLLFTSAALLFGACVSRPPAEPAPAALRVMSYNIRHGRGMDDRVDLTRIAAVIRDARADVVLLQEVDRGTQRTDRRDLAAELAALTGMHAVFSRNIPHQGGEYGNATLSRFPVVAWTNLHFRMLRPGEQRGLLQVTAEVPGHGRVQFWNTHIDYRPDDAERLGNVTEINALLARTTEPVILGGDFNDTPGSRVHAALGGRWQDAWPAAGEGDGFTIPAERPAKRIDWILTPHGSPWRAVRAWVPETEASDHRPVVVEFRRGRAEE